MTFVIDASEEAVLFLDVGAWKALLLARRKFMQREKVEEVLDMIRPMLMRDGGNVELVNVDDDGTVSVKLQGACRG